MPLVSPRGGSGGRGQTAGMTHGKRPSLNPNQAQTHAMGHVHESIPERSQSKNIDTIHDCTMWRIGVAVPRVALA